MPDLGPRDWRTLMRDLLQMATATHQPLECNCEELFEDALKCIAQPLDPGYEAGHKDGYKRALDDVRDLLDLPVARIGLIPPLLPENGA